MLIILCAIIISVRCGSYASWLWRNNFRLPSVGIWLITAAMLIVSVVLRKV